MDLIQVFVEALDKCFENVCELDLIFHSDRVNYILDEIIMAGMVLETNINNILTAINDQNKLHTASLTSTVTSSGIAPPSGLSGGNSGNNGISSSSSAYSMSGGSASADNNSSIFSSFANIMSSTAPKK